MYTWQYIASKMSSCKALPLRRSMISRERVCTNCQSQSSPRAYTRYGSHVGAHHGSVAVAPADCDCELNMAQISSSGLNHEPDTDLAFCINSALRWSFSTCIGLADWSTDSTAPHDASHHHSTTVPQRHSTANSTFANLLVSDYG